MEVTKNASESVALPKNVSTDTFSFALKNVTNSIPQGALPSPAILVLDLVTDKKHDDMHIFEEERLDIEVSKGYVHSSPPVYNVEHIDMHEETFVSPVQVIPSAHQSTAEPGISALVDTVDAACASIQQPLTNWEPTVISTIDESLVDNSITSQVDLPTQHFNSTLQHDLDLWQWIKEYDKKK